MKQVAFSVNISQGYADWVIHQQYFNNLDQSREIVFLMPLNLGLELTQIEVDFVMMDGTIRTVVTKVIERGKEEQIYEDKVASTKTALAETLPKLDFDPSFMRFQLGNMPPHCLVTVRAFFAQELKVEDLSYCFRIPAHFVPAYLGNSSCSLMVEQSEKYKSVQETAKVEAIPAKTNWLGLWDLEIRLRGQGTFERLCSLNHPV